MSITEYASELKLPNIKLNSEKMIQEAELNKIGYHEFLEKILEEELNIRKGNRVKHRLKQARFPFKKTLDEYDLSVFDKDVANQVKVLYDLDFINNKENIILIGNPGVGKTHLAIALGIASCLEYKKVLYISVPNLIIEMKEAMSLNKLNKYKSDFEKYDLVILDELGYVSFEKESSEILFNMLSNRNNKGSTIITTNLTFDRWSEVFKDEIMTAAIIDRLAHKSHLIDLSGDSYRAKETREWIQAQ